MKKKILVINSNSNPGVTEVVKAGLPNYCSDKDVEITCVTAGDGPQGIDTLLDIAISAVETVKIVARNRYDYDAYIIACGSDPGLDASRLIADAPVVGICEAGMLMACTLGYKFAIIPNAELDIPVIEERVVHYGLRERFAAARALNLSTAELKDRKQMFERVVQVGRELVEEDKAEVIVLPGSVQIGIEKEAAKSIGVPVLSGMVCAFKMAEALIACGQKTSRVRKYRLREKLDFLVGYEDFQEVYSISE